MTHDEILAELAELEANGERVRVLIANALNQLDRALDIINDIENDEAQGIVTE